MKTQLAFAPLLLASLITGSACPGGDDAPGSSTADDSTTTAATLTGEPSTGDILLVANSSSGTSVTYDIVIIGTSA